MSDCAITAFAHCRQCMMEKPPGISPQDWATLSVGLTGTGAVQVWCNRHDMEVATFQIARKH